MDEARSLFNYIYSIHNKLGNDGAKLANAIASDATIASIVETELASDSMKKLMKKIGPAHAYVKP